MGCFTEKSYFRLHPFHVDSNDHWLIKITNVQQRMPIREEVEMSSMKVEMFGFSQGGS